VFFEDLSSDFFSSEELFHYTHLSEFNLEKDFFSLSNSSDQNISNSSHESSSSQISDDIDHTQKFEGANSRRKNRMSIVRESEFFLNTNNFESRNLSELINENIIQNNFFYENRNSSYSIERVDKLNKEGLRKNLKVMFFNFLKKYLNFLLRNVDAQAIFFKNLPKKFISDVVINRNKSWLRISIKDLYLGYGFDFEYPHKENNKSVVEFIDKKQILNEHHEHLLSLLSENLKSVMVIYFENVFENHLRHIKNKYSRERREKLYQEAKIFVNYYETSRGKIRRVRRNL
jgi:hypothetical protein